MFDKKWITKRLTDSGETQEEQNDGSIIIPDIPAFKSDLTIAVVIGISCYNRVGQYDGSGNWE